jgi:hypothetical protein
MNKFGRFQHLVGLCAAALTVSLATAAPQAGSAKVKAFLGSATFGGQPASIGAVGGAGTVVTTGAASDITLDLGINGPIAKVLENSSVSIDDLTFDTAGAEPVISTKLAVKSGKIEANVRKTSSQSSYIVKTPTSTASIRGTTFTIYDNGTVLVWDGCVDVTYRDPQSGREVKYNVCKGQMFDSIKLAVVEIPAGTPGPTVPTGAAAASAQAPVGATIFVSPGAGPGVGQGSGSAQ